MSFSKLFYRSDLNLGAAKSQHLTHGKGEGRMQGNDVLTFSRILQGLLLELSEVL